MPPAERSNALGVGPYRPPLIRPSLRLRLQSVPARNCASELAGVLVGVAVHMVGDEGSPARLPGAG
jgi:hypothetical protein